MAQDTYYVNISRERHEVVVFTDDADKLPERVQRLGVKGLAHDLGGPLRETAEMTIDAYEAALDLGNP